MSALTTPPTVATVTPNPALDVTYVVDGLEVGAENRVAEVLARPGGKGINTASVLACLGVDVVVLGLAGGEPGADLRARLAQRGVRHLLTSIVGSTRRTVAVVDRGANATTLLNEPGPPVTTAEWQSLLATVTRVAGEVPVITMSGSLPGGIGIDGYADLVNAARAAARTGSAAPTVVVDTSGPALLAACAARPDVVKPNAAELAAVLPSIADPLDRARELVQRGARCVVVSSGAAGLRLLTADAAVGGRLPRALAGNATGAGDAVVAALAQVLTGGDTARFADPAGLAELVRRAVAVSAAAVLAPVAGEVDPDDVSMLMKEVEVIDE